MASSKYGWSKKFLNNAVELCPLRLVPTIASYLSFCESVGASEWKFRTNGFTETALINAISKQSDHGRYKMSIAVIGATDSLIPSYLAIMGHNVWIIDKIIPEDLEFQHHVLDGLRLDRVHIVRETFLRWSPTTSFRCIAFLDSIAKQSIGTKRDLMEDSGDGLAISKARAVKTSAGIIFFTIEICDCPIKCAELRAGNIRRRFYTREDFKTRILPFAEAVGSKIKDPASDIVSWIAR